LTQVNDGRDSIGDHIAMNRRSASLMQAKLCRARAQAETDRHDYWLREALKWERRAVEELGGVEIAFQPRREVPKPAKYDRRTQRN